MGDLLKLNLVLVTDLKKAELEEMVPLGRGWPHVPDGPCS